MNICIQHGILKEQPFTNNQILLTLLFFIAFSFSVYATTYYVDAVNGNDSNNGKSETSAWKTINKVNNYSFSSGDIIAFKRGQVFQGYTLTPPRNNLTFTAYGNGAKPIIDGEGIRSAFSKDNTSYLSFWGIEFYNSPYACFLTNGSKHLTIDSCTFDGNNIANYACAIWASNAGGSLADVTVKRSTIENTTGSDKDVGLYITGDSILVEKCKFINNKNSALHFNYFDAYQPDAKTLTGVIVRYNYFINNLNACVDQGTEGAQYYYNLIILNKNNSYNQGFVFSWNYEYSKAPNDGYIFNNTFINTSTNQYGCVPLYFYGILTINNFTIKNNIIYMSGYNANNYFIYQQLGGGTLIANNNLYYNPGTSARWCLNGINYSSFTKWQGTNLDLNSNFVNPLFTNLTSGDYSLQDKSPALNKGYYWGQTNDFLGNPIVDQPDIGAFEYQGGNSSVIFYLNTKVYLAGCYKNGIMSTELLNKGFIPASQPYNTQPWNYIGTQKISSFPPNMVDWVLVTLRSDTSARSTIALRAALLLSNGSVVSIDGSSPVTFKNINPGNYYIVIKHRNHLAVMSAVKVNFSNDSTSNYDFTSSESKAYGNNPMENLGNGVYGMYPGDANGDGVISQSDMLNFWLPQFMNGLDGYNSADFNLDGSVTASDNNMYWLINNGKVTQVPN